MCIFEDGGMTVTGLMWEQCDHRYNHSVDSTVRFSPRMNKETWVSV